GMRIRIFRTFVWSLFLLLAISQILADLYIARYSEHQLEDMLTQQLSLTARTLAAEVSRTNPPILNDWAKAAAPTSQSRIEVIDRQGTLIADSQQEIDNSENFAEQPE